MFETILGCYLLILNIFTFILFGVDKYRAKKDLWRIPESRLFLCAILGGSIGAELGIHLFHHKTRHLRFTLGIPAILFLQLTLICLALFYLSSII